MAFPASGGRQTAWTGLALAGFALLPLVATPYQLTTLVVSMVFLLPALGLNLILGYTGMLSLAQMGFFGVGGYASALLAMHYGTPFWFNLLAACIVPALSRGAAGDSGTQAAAYLLRHVHASRFVAILESTAKNWISLTRGDMGLSGVPRPRLGLWSGGYEVHTVTGYYYLGLLLSVLAIALLVTDRALAGRTLHGCHP